MRFRLAPFLALAVTGCSALPEHSRDFAEIWRLEIQVGAGVRAAAKFGDDWVMDEGTEAGYRVGACWGELDARPSFDGALLRLLSRVRGRPKPHDGEGEMADIAPRPGLRTPDSRNPDLHSSDLEAGLTFGPIGFTIGFSPGEFVDFLAGFAGRQLDRRRTLRWGSEESGSEDPPPAKPRSPSRPRPPPPEDERKPVVGSRDPGATSK